MNPTARPLPRTRTTPTSAERVRTDASPSSLPPSSPATPGPGSSSRRDAAAQVFVNGRFLSQRASGVQRFARELVKALDTRIGQSGDPRRWTLLVPRGVDCDLSLAHIAVRHVGGGGGHLWDQALRWHVGRRDRLVNLANSGPIWHRRSVVIVHDAAVYRTPGNFTRAYGLVHRLLGRLLAHRATLGTVSKFSRDELAQVLGLDPAAIFVVANSCEHLRDITPEPDVLARLGLQARHYFLFIGSPVPNKNLATALAAFTQLRAQRAAAGDEPVQFVIVGASNKAVFGQGLGTLPEGALLAGPASDGEVKALLQSASALVFPSLYEGFGIPPLEAMLSDCPVVAADIAPVREVCGDAALRFAPTDAAAMAAAMAQVHTDAALRRALVERGQAQAARYSWQHSAGQLLAALDTLA